MSDSQRVAVRTQRGEVDALIDPLETRRVLTFAFDAAIAHGHREHLALEMLAE